jgi:hypothetical protein
LNSINDGNLLARAPYGGGITVEGGGVMGLIIGLVLFVLTGIFGALRGRALR